eukprot:SAG11_NODE_12982_length_675_cov_576.359375_1_plen_48_part_00
MNKNIRLSVTRGTSLEIAAGGAFAADELQLLDDVVLGVGKLDVSRSV